MKSARLLSAVFFAAAVAVAGCEFQRKSTSPSTTQVLEPSAAIPSLLGTWTTLAAKPTDSSSQRCTDFVWTVTSQTDTDITGTFTAVCLGSANITGTGTAHITGSTVTISINGNGSMPGLESCPFALSGTGTIEGDLIRVPYTGSTCLGPVSGVQTLQRSLIQPTPTPAPAPIPHPGPRDVLLDAVVLNSPLDMGGWPMAATVTALELRPTGVHIEFTKQDGPGRWPDVYPPGWDEPLQYTLGMCMYINARWYCSAAINFWYGLDENGGPPQQYAQNWFYDPSRWAPMTYNQPAVGETIGFFVCEGVCRNNTTGSLSPLRERSNVVLVPMPGPGGASFTF